MVQKVINPILYQNQVDKTTEIINDYKNLCSAVEPDSGKNIAFEGMPIFGRVNSVPEKITEQDYAPAMGLVSLAIMNGPEDLRDVMSAYKQIKEGFPNPKSYHSGYDNKYAQHPFSFFRGTIFNDYLNPFSKKCPNPELATKLIQEDKTLWDTKFGKWVKELLKIEESKIVTRIERIESTNKNPKFIFAKKFITNNPIKDIIARAMTRTTKLGLIALGLIEGAHIVHEVANGKNIFAETGKSALTLGTTVVGTGVFGAIGAKYLGPTGSLAGISFGSITGAMVNKAMD